MRNFIRFLLAATILVNASASAGPIAVAVHGGAGTIQRGAMTAEQEQAYREALTTALDTAHGILSEGGTALDAVEQAVRGLEDNPLFNAGKGAVFTHHGHHELDASIMDGATLAAGAVAGVRHVRNPISLARQVMEHSPHVLLSGDGAEEFALSRSLPLVPASYFDTPWRREQLDRAIEAERLGHLSDGAQGGYFGTVGVVALDARGNLAAGTSTGGTTNKRYGRVGDSPVIGAGTYANNATCAVSATGTGEYFIRAVVAHDISARMAYGKATLAQAVEQVIDGSLAEIGGDGGVIALDAAGNVVMQFNTSGMYRASIDGDGKRFVGIYR